MARPGPKVEAAIEDLKIQALETGARPGPTYLDPDAPDPPKPLIGWLSTAELTGLNEADTTQLLLRRRLESYAERRRKLDKSDFWHRTTDRVLYTDLEYSILDKTEPEFRYVFAKWFGYVDGEIRKWEIKQEIAEFQKTGVKTGFWGSWYGEKLSHYYPEYCGASMTQPPPYLSVWGPKVRQVYENYEFFYFGRYLQHQAFWASVGFFGTIAVQFQAWTQYSARPLLFKSWLLRPLHPFIVGFCFSVVPGSWTHLFGKKKRRKEAMDRVLRDTSFLGAKARLIADDVMWPEDYHNRDYLNGLPRDEYDEFVWSVDDDDIAWGNFDKKEWGFVFDQTIYEPDTTKEQIRRYAYLFLGRPYDYKPPVKVPKTQVLTEPTQSTE